MSDPASEDWYKNTYLPQQDSQKQSSVVHEELPFTTWDFVCADIAEREQMGAKKYGKYLTPSTSEDMLQHLYEELLDATVYIKTLILQRKNNVSNPT